MKIKLLLLFLILSFKLHLFSLNRLFVLDNPIVSTFSISETNILKEFDIQFESFKAYNQTKIHNKSIKLLIRSFGKDWKVKILNKLDSAYQHQKNPKKNAQILLNQLEGWIDTAHEEE